MSSFCWELFRYSLPLKEPLRMLGQELHERTGMILRLYHENDGSSAAKSYGEGEVAPLTGMHPESLSDAEKQIRNYLSGKKSVEGQFPLNLFASVLFAEDGPVYQVPIHGTIDMGLPYYIQRVVDEAEENNANVIIFDIDTFGGRVDAATQIKDIILDSKVTTIAFVNKRAISAGALICLLYTSPSPRD